MTNHGSDPLITLVLFLPVTYVSIFVHATILELLIGVAGSVIFSLYLIAQIQRVRTTEDTLPNAIILAVGIYISVLNLFYSLLRIFGVLGGSRN